MKNASFSLAKYNFDKVLIDYSLQTETEISLNFQPKGVFKQGPDNSVFELTFVFSA